MGGHEGFKRQHSRAHSKNWAQSEGERDVRPVERISLGQAGRASRERAFNTPPHPRKSVVEMDNLERRGRGRHRSAFRGRSAAEQFFARLHVRSTRFRQEGWREYSFSSPPHPQIGERKSSMRETVNSQRNTFDSMNSQQKHQGGASKHNHF